MRKMFRLLPNLIVMILLSACHQSSAPPEDMVLIPCGEFIMGTDAEQANSDQHHAHIVHLDVFYIDAYEITNRKFEEFIFAGGYQKKEYWTDEGWAFIQKHRISKPWGRGKKLFDALNQPVVGVSCYEADAYCRWAGGRLPTEAEWEKAARGSQGLKYPWGNEMNFANVTYLLGGGYRTVPVGSYVGNSSPYGVQDCAGNVWEWCADWYDEKYYARSPDRNPDGPTEGSFKVLRGGSYGSNRLQMQTTYRYYKRPDRTALNIGFRCVMDTGKKRK